MQAEVSVSIDGRVVSFMCAYDQPLLDAALAASVPVPYLCRAGHCGTCMVIVSEGEVDCPAAAVLSRRDRAQGYVLACQAKPRSRRVTLTYGS